MITRSEVPFTINGVKSSIHCLYQTAVRTSRTVPKVYHYHDYIEFLYATSSDTGLWINGEKHVFRDGDLAIINSGEPHAFTFNDNSEYVCLKFSPGIFSADSGCMFQLQYLLPMFSKDLKKRIIHRHELEDIDITSLVNEIMSEWEDKKTASELIIRANIFKIFTHVIRIWEKNNLINFTSKATALLASF